ADDEPLDGRPMVIDTQSSCYVPLQTPDGQQFRLVPMARLKEEDIPKGVLDALRRQGTLTLPPDDDAAPAS
ncbi:unnamed protein product, partial [Polarella glacialis]